MSICNDEWDKYNKFNNINFVDNNDEIDNDDNDNNVDIARVNSLTSNLDIVNEKSWSRKFIENEFLTLIKNGRCVRVQL